MPLQELTSMFDIRIVLVMYAFALGWFLHSQKHEILWFFKNHVVGIAIGLIVAWPILTIALFLVNVVILQSTLLMYPILVSMVAFVVFWIWLMRTGVKKKA
jgi:hypothetical protein